MLLICFLTYNLIEKQLSGHPVSSVQSNCIGVPIFSVQVAVD